MESFYSSIGISLAAETKMRYGQQAGIQDEWKRIISIDSASERKKEIDNLVSAMESNRENNGFYGKEDSVKINQIGNEFKIDDNELYYMFFENLRILKQNHPAEDESRILFHGVLHTVKNYFGGFGANKNVRMALTSVDIEEDIIPSISAQKGRNCSLCAERSSVSHNLWLLTGAESYCVNSTNCSFGNVSSEYENDGHMFCVVQIDGIYKVFDPTMQVYMRVSGNPIEKMLKGEAFELTTKDGDTYTYAKESKNKLKK